MSLQDPASPAWSRNKLKAAPAMEEKTLPPPLLTYLQKSKATYTEKIFAMLVAKI